MTQNSILEFRGPTRWLSNYHEEPVWFEGVRYPTNEHAFQAAKTLDLEQRKLIQNCATPAQARQMGQLVSIRPDWDWFRLDVMLDLNRQKFISDPLRSQLIGTGQAWLEEGNRHGDRFWGTMDGVGENRLGRILMQVRAELAGQEWPKPDFTYLTSRLAIGNVESRSVIGFAAVVSILTQSGSHRGRPWGPELTHRTPPVPAGVPVFLIDLADGEGRVSDLDGTDLDPEGRIFRGGQMVGHQDDRDLIDFLDPATSFIADHIKEGPVLVHCGQGRSRSPSVAAAYLIRYGMGVEYVLDFIKAKRPEVDPAEVFTKSLREWAQGFNGKHRPTPPLPGLHRPKSPTGVICRMGETVQVGRRV